MSLPMLPTTAPPPSSFALASAPSMPSQTGAPPAGEGAAYLLLSPNTGNTDPPLPPPPPPALPSTASTVVRNDFGNGDTDGGELAKAAGIRIGPFPPLLIPESALPTLPLQLSLPLLPHPTLSPFYPFPQCYRRRSCPRCCCGHFCRCSQICRSVLPSSSYDAIWILTLNSNRTLISSSTLQRRRYPWN